MLGGSRGSNIAAKRTCFFNRVRWNLYRRPQSSEFVSAAIQLKEDISQSRGKSAKRLAFYIGWMTGSGRLQSK